MKVADLIALDSFSLATPGVNTDIPITSYRSCDLLSWVMAKGREHEAWITVQLHSNIVAVASLLEMSCIIIPEKLTPDEDTIKKAIDNDIPILVSKLDSYEIFKVFYEHGLS